MSDTTTKVSCDRHGESHATFVCRHLAAGTGRGFETSGEGSDPRPDAWCGECEAVRQEEGEWNERSEAFAGVSLLCAGCYDDVRRRQELSKGFRCRCCGEWHDGVPTDFGFEFPASYVIVPEAERERRCEINADLCVIDDEEFYIRGRLEIPVIDGPGPFVWGVWTSLSRTSFLRATELWTTPGREGEKPYFGWLNSAIPLYPDTLNLKTLVHTRPVGERPWVELEPTDHPLAVEQRNGITMARVVEIAEALLHPKRS